MQTLGRHYVRYFNYTYRRSGTLWEGRFRSCIVDVETYLLVCQRYIVVSHPGDYRWSSYRCHGLGRQTQLWTPHRAYTELGRDVAQRTKAYRELFRAHVEPSQVHEIRQATNQGMVLGSDRFKQEVERLAGRRVSLLKRGPKRKRKEKDGQEFLL
jgi:putative transposase